ncbi:hypothetical protein M5689_010163 [Euphorbia peplus]|nr:hypothetical protein M5689_010163 [Euphorbia peplus]
MLVSISWTSDKITRNLLCHLERLNIQNYILIGPHSEFLHDLTRRGHPTIYANQLLDSMRAGKLIKLQNPSSEMVNLIVKAYVIQKCLGYNYHSLIVDASMLLLNAVAGEVAEGSLSRESRRKLGFMVAKMLEENGGRVNWVDENMVGMKISDNGVNKSSLEAKKMVYWSMENMDLVQKRLDELGLWVIDGDSSCKAVICHQS